MLFHTFILLLTIVVSTCLQVVPSSVGLNTSWSLPITEFILRVEGFNVSFAEGGLAIQTTKVYPANIWWPVNLTGKISSLTLQQDGNLVQRYADGSISWQTWTADKEVATMEILSSGNLVLLTSNKFIVWQSFDSPTNIIMLNQSLKLGSRLSSRPPLSILNMTGNFYLEVEASGVYLYAWSVEGRAYRYASFCKVKGQEIDYIELQRDGLKCFGKRSKLLMTETTASGADYLQLVSNGDFQGVWGFNSGSLISGTVKSCGSPVAACGEFGYCTSTGQCSCFFDASYTFIDQSTPDRGCIPREPPERNCEGESSRFVAYPGFTNRVAEFNTSEFLVASLEECKSSCLKSCSCNGLVFHQSTNSCVVLSKIYTSWNQSIGGSSQLDATTFLKVRTRKTLQQQLSTTTFKRWIVAPIVLLAGAFFVCLCCMGKYVLRQLRQRRGSQCSPLVVPNLPQAFKYKDLVKATDNFSTHLGQGSFGTVFKGVLPDGTKVAVKHLSNGREGMKQFEAEVSSVGSIHHKNLVKLVGYTARGNSYYLIYEYLANMSLDKWLFTSEQPQPGHPLDWHSRFLIALDIAKGLHYLHDGCPQQVLHLDIKPQNILLDATFQAKICDFGLSRLVHRGVGSIQVAPRGTPGYMAPEWLKGQVTDKTDVYSFGIVLLEIVTGRKVAKPLEINAVMQQVGQRLLSHTEIELEQVRRVTIVGISCIADEPCERPSMEKALKLLEGQL